MNDLGTILLEGVSVAIIGVIGQIILGRISRSDARKDKAEERQDAVSQQIASIRTAVMLLMLDQIKRLGLRYISDGEISYEDRRLLHRMHDNYHNDLGGNGDLNQIMEDVDELPLKKK